MRSSACASAALASSIHLSMNRTQSCTCPSVDWKPSAISLSEMTTLPGWQMVEDSRGFRKATIQIPDGFAFSGTDHVNTFPSRPAAFGGPTRLIFSAIRGLLVLLQREVSGQPEQHPIFAQGGSAQFAPHRVRRLGIPRRRN